MGHLPSKNKLPSTKFTQPRNGDVFTEDTPLVVTIASKNFKTGLFANATSNFLAAPQQLDPTDGTILGHYHIVIEALTSFGQTSLTDPRIFTFSKEVPDDLIGTTPITLGLPSGFYRMTATAHAANHQPVLVPLVQRGLLNDVVYFSVIPKNKRSIVRSVESRDNVLERTSTNWTQGNSRPTKWRAATLARRQTQTSLVLDSTIISAGFASDGNTPPQASQVPSLTSTNNFINYCATLTGVPLTNGKQVTSESCNPAPMGIVPPSDNMPSVRFTQPTFNSSIPENATFSILFNATNLFAGQFVNPSTNFLAAPQQVSQQGQIMGHISVVIESLASMGQIEPTDPPSLFAFFKGVSQASPGADGLFEVDVPGGLPLGVYRLSSIVSAANHQPILTPVATRGAVDDTVYFNVVPANQTAGSVTSLVMCNATKPNLPNYASTTDMGTMPNLGPSSSNQPLTIGVALPDDAMAAGPSRAPTYPLGKRPRPSAQRQSSASALSSAPSYRTIDRSPP